MAIDCAWWKTWLNVLAIGWEWIYQLRLNFRLIQEWMKSDTLLYWSGSLHRWYEFLVQAYIRVHQSGRKLRRIFVRVFHTSSFYVHLLSDQTKTRMANSHIPLNHQGQCVILWSGKTGERSETEGWWDIEVGILNIYTGRWVLQNPVKIFNIF